MTEQKSHVAVKRYINSLDESAKEFALFQLIIYPESRAMIVKCVNEFNRFYNFPIKNGEKHSV